MDSTTANLLSAMATKIVTTTEYLWRVLVGQAPISAMINIAIVLILIGVTYVAYRVMRKMQTLYKADRSEYEYEIAYSASWAFLLVLCVVSLIVVPCSMENIVTGLFNPEYWALKQIINSL